MRILLIFIIVLLTFFNQFAFGQNVKAFYVGHSLSDQIPDMVKSLSDDHEDVNFDWVYQSIPGSPLSWQWERKDAMDYTPNPPHYYGFYDETGGLPTGDFDVLVLTESVPRYLSIIELTYQYADSFFVFANLHNPNIRVYLYEDWHCLLSGTPTGCDYDVDANPWRQRLEDDLPMWESVVDTLNTRFNPSNPVCLIPAGQGLARVYDSIVAGALPGLNNIEDLFSDDIHLNDVGKYFVACVHFATIHERSPVGLTNQLQVWWGGDFDAPSEELALAFQEIAWQTVLDYPRTCVTQTAGVSSFPSKETFSVYPNPASTKVSIVSDTEIDNVLIVNSDGRVVLNSNSTEIDITGLSTGIYYVKIGEVSRKLIKL